MDPVVNSTCNYGQVMSALNAQSPAAAAQFNSSPVAQGWLQQFLAAPRAQRVEMAQQAQSAPEFQPYLGVAQQVANTCNNY
jgi:hemophore-related protein